MFLSLRLDKDLLDCCSSAENCFLFVQGLVSSNPQFSFSGITLIHIGLLAKCQNTGISQKHQNSRAGNEYSNPNSITNKCQLC